MNPLVSGVAVSSLLGRVPDTLAGLLSRGPLFAYTHVVLLHWPVTVYSGYYDDARRHAEDEDGTSFSKDWADFREGCSARWEVVLGFCTVYNAITIGMLSALPGIVDVSIICGIVCMFASVVCFAIAMLLRTHLKKHEDPARGKVRLARTTESRWTSVPLLFAIPDAWFVWASIAFFAFFLTFYWGRLAHAPGGACGAPIPQIAVGARFYVAASAAFSVLVASGFAHVALVMWACHRLVARDAATPAANMP